MRQARFGDWWKCREEWTALEVDQPSRSEADLHWRQQDGLGHHWIQAKTRRRDLQRDEEHVDQGRMEFFYTKTIAPVLPVSGWMGDNLWKKSENMAWWGTKVIVGAEEFRVDTLCGISSSGICKGVGDVLAGRVEQGQETIFLPAHAASNPCTREFFSVKCTISASSRRHRLPHQGSGQEQHASFRRRDDKEDTTLGQKRGSTHRSKCWTSLVVKRQGVEILSCGVPPTGIGDVGFQQM